MQNNKTVFKFTEKTATDSQTFTLGSVNYDESTTHMQYFIELFWRQ